MRTRRTPNARRLLALALMVVVALAPQAGAAADAALTIDDALALAEQRNAALARERGVGEQLKKQLDGEDRALGRVGGAAKTGSGAEFEERLHDARVAIAEALFEQRRAELAATVRAGFARCIALRDVQALARDYEAALGEVLKVADERKAKPGARTEEALARVAWARARQLRATADRDLAQAAGELLLLLGARAPENLRIRGDLPARPGMVEELDALTAKALATRGDLRAARLEHDAALDALTLAQRRPPGTVGGAPAPGHQGGSLDEAQARVERALGTVTALEELIRTDVATSGTRVLHANQAVAASANADLPSFTAQRAAFVDGLRKGSATLGDALQALREARDVRRDEVLGRAEIAAAEAELRRALGAR